MYKLERTQIIKKNINVVFKYFENPANLSKITPSDLGFMILNDDKMIMKKGAKFRYMIKIVGIKVHWETLIAEYNPPNNFTDVQKKGPYKKWIHTHTFISKGDQTEMHDVVEYDLYGWVLAPIIHFFVKKKLKDIFDYRQKVIEEVF